MPQSSTFSRILGLWGAEIAGGAVGALVGHAVGYGDAGFVVGVAVGGVVHLLLRPNSE